jgi:transcriptional regulator with XRE-family HTH domain
MARAALNLSIRDLADLATVRPATISHFEGGGDSYASTVQKLREVLEARGVVFVADGEASIAGGAGVRLKGSD